MNKANYFIFCKNSGVYILKITQGDDKWNSKRRKDTKGENLKKISQPVKCNVLDINL